MKKRTMLYVDHGDVPERLEGDLYVMDHVATSIFAERGKVYELVRPREAKMLVRVLWATTVHVGDRELQTLIFREYGEDDV